MINNDVIKIYDEFIERFTHGIIRCKDKPLFKKTYQNLVSTLKKHRQDAIELIKKRKVKEDCDEEAKKYGGRFKDLEYFKSCQEIFK